MMPRRTRARFVALIGLFALFLTSLWPVTAAPVSKPLIPTPAPQDAEQPAISPAPAPLPPSPLAFEPNVGQFPQEVAFQTQALGGTVAFLSDGLRLTLPGRRREASIPLPQQPFLAARLPRTPYQSSLISHEPEISPAVVHQQFLDTSVMVVVTATDQLSGTVNYLMGNDPSHWYSGVPTYGTLRYTELYPGVSVTYASQDGQLKSTYTLAAGISVETIRWQYEGIADVQIDSTTGALHLFIPPTDPEGQGTTLIEDAPIAWQVINDEQVFVPIQYVRLTDGSIGFDLGSYQPAYPVTIDPTLSYSQFDFYGAQSHTDAVAVDADGNVYTVSSVNAVWYEDTNLWVIKRDATEVERGRAYLGGSDLDEAYGLALDPAGFIIVVGMTTSPDFVNVPPDSPAIDSRLRIAMTDETHDRCVDDVSEDYCTDAFIIRLTPELALGTLGSYQLTLGGHRSDAAYGVAVDSRGDLYITGYTNSMDFPTEPPGQSACLGEPGYCSGDTFVARISGGGTQISYSRYLGAVGADYGSGVAVDADGTAYLTGAHNAIGFDAVDDDTYVAKLAPDGTLQYQITLGQSGEDRGSAIQLGIGPTGADAVYITGSTVAGAFPIVEPVPNLTTYHGDSDAFIARLDITGTLHMSSILGGSGRDWGSALAADEQGRVYVTGTAEAGGGFPMVNAPEGIAGEGDNAFVAILHPQGTLELSMQLGDATGTASYGPGNYPYGIATDFPGGPTLEDSGVLSRGFLSKVAGLPPSAPRETISYYVQRNNLEAMRLLGCESRQYREQGMVVLAFGRPRNAGTDTNPSYVVGLIGADPPTLVPLSTVEELVLAFAEGYINWSGCVAGAPVPTPGLPNLALAVGTNNSKNASAQTNPDLNRASGIAWAAMVNRLNDEVEQRGWFPAVRVLGGLDAEFGNDPLFGVDPTSWIQGYGQTTVFPFVAYNACNGCPVDQPRATWNEPELEKVYRASIAPALAYPLPQVYFTLQAKQWLNVRRYAFERFGDRKPLAGPMVSCRATVDCNFADRTNWQLAQPDQFLSPPQSWQALYDTLNDATTPDGSTNEVQQVALPFVTDLVYQTAPATFRRTPRS